MEPLVWFTIPALSPLSWCAVSDRNRQLGQRKLLAMPSPIFCLLSDSSIRGTAGDATVVWMWSWPSEVHRLGERPLGGYGFHWWALGMTYRRTWSARSHSGKDNHIHVIIVCKIIHTICMIILRWKSQRGIRALLILANLPFRRKNSKSQAQSLRGTVDSSWSLIKLWSSNCIFLMFLANVMADFMCQLDWATAGAPDIWSNIILSISRWD